MLAGAIAFFSTLHAAAAVDGAKRAERRVLTLAVLVTVVANAPLFITTVRVFRTVCLTGTRWEAVVGALIADPSVSAVARREAGDAATALGVALRCFGAGAIGVYLALKAATRNTTQLLGTGRAVAAAGRLAARPTGQAARRTSWRAPAVACHGASTCGRHIAGRGQSALARRTTLRDVEREALIARARARAGQEPQQREARELARAHGCLLSWAASLAAKPCG